MKQPHKLVTVVITSQTISCALIEIYANGTLRASAHGSYPVNNAIIDGVPMRPSVMVNILQDYKDRYTLSDCEVAVCLANGAIQEQFTTMPTTAADDTCLHKGSRRYGYQCIAPGPDGYFIFCNANIAAQHLFSYQLIFMKAGMRLTAISGPTSTSIAVYHRIYDSAYRQTQLAYDLQNCNYQVDNLITDQMVDRLLMQSSTQTTNKRALLYAVGLALGHEEHV